MDPSERSRLIRETWRIRCPRGHADIRDKQGPTVFCRGCEQRYYYDELIDLRDGALPADP